MLCLPNLFKLWLILTCLAALPWLDCLLIYKALFPINTLLASGREVGEKYIGHYCTRFFCPLFVVMIDCTWCQILGRVPTLQEGNAMESVFNLPWINHSPIVLGTVSIIAFFTCDHWFFLTYDSLVLPMFLPNFRLEI